MPRGNPDGGQWTRVGVGGNGDAGRAPSQIGDDDDTRVGAPSLRSGVETTTLPGNRQIVRDRSGTEPWEAYVNTLRPDGSVSERVVINRDGSAIRSQFSTTPELTGWDESNTVIGAGGDIVTFQNLGKTQTILDGAGQVVQVASWTRRGPEPEAFVQPAFFASRETVKDTFGLGLGLFNWLVTQSMPDRSAVFGFSVREFVPGEDSSLALDFVGSVTQEDLGNVCKRVEEVQAVTDESADAIRRLGALDLSPSAFGTAVHLKIKKEINKLADPNFFAELSVLKSLEETYGTKDSVRIDIFENRGDGTVCIYDIKTGKRGLSAARAAELAQKVFFAFDGAMRIIVIEVRPTS